MRWLLVCDGAGIHLQAPHRQAICDLDGRDGHDQARLRPQYLRRLQRSFLTRHAAALVDAGTESHKYLISLLSGHKAPRFFTAYNAVDNEALERNVRKFAADLPAFNAFKKRFPARIILFVGQLIERKGIAQLLEAYRILLRRQREPIGLIMLGQGPLDSHLREIKAKEGLAHLFVEGFIDQAVYPRYLAVADVLVLPSLFDPNPLVVFEGMAAGKPIILSNRAGNAPDFVENGLNGFVVDPFAVDDMATKIAFILDATPIDRAKMGARSREFVRKANYDASAKAFVDAARCAASSER